jgi:hypothetical protein
MDIEEKIRQIEEEIRNTPYNKATQHHIGKLKAKLARLKEKSLKKAPPGRREGFAVRKAGDATVALVGFPSVGKSTLINKLTNAQSEIGAYDFTTLRVIPSVMEYKGARIQILDLPGLISGASSGRGRGREVISMIRSADLILTLVDVFNPLQYKIILNELREAGIRPDEEPPKVKIYKKSRGGIKVNSTVELTKITDTEIKGVLSEFRIYNAEIVIREDITVDRFIDALAGNRVYIPSLVVLNKIDLVRDEYLREIKRELQREYIPISAVKGTNIEKLKEEIYKRLNFIRVYMKPQGGKADMREPMIVVRGSTVGDVCDRLHRELRENFRYAKVWGSSVRFNAQRVGLNHVLEDGDIVTIVSK